MHRKQTREEQEHAVGAEIFNRVACVDSDKDDCVYLGTTKAGTPLHVYRPVAEADFRICAGNIEYHYFAGYSGGAKALLPGVCSRETVQRNHRMMVQDAACAGKIDGNPVREDIDDAVSLCSVDYIVNVILDERKKIIRCVSGHYLDAHRAGCAFLDGFNKVPIQEKADIVITSPGGYPKDINMYQAQKALDNAKYAVKDGGCVIWAARCQEGLGEETFERWMLGHSHPDEMIEHIRRDFQLGGHKAAAIAMMLRNTRILLVSDMEPALIRRMHMEPAGSVQEAMDRAFKSMGRRAKVIVMPNGGATLPAVNGGSI
jgi:nickel-dependent lactate racemase